MRAPATGTSKSFDSQAQCVQVLGRATRCSAGRVFVRHRAGADCPGGGPAEFRRSADAIVTSIACRGNQGGTCLLLSEILAVVSGVPGSALGAWCLPGCGGTSAARAPEPPGPDRQLAAGTMAASALMGCSERGFDVRTIRDKRLEYGQTRGSGRPKIGTDPRSGKPDMRAK